MSEHNEISQKRRRMEEASEEKGRKLQKQREAKQRRLAAETEEDKSFRLQKQREASKKYRLSQTDEQRSLRLANMKTAKSKRLSAETDEQRLQRLKKKQEDSAAMRSKETNEQHEAQKVAALKRYNKQRDNKKSAESLNLKNLSSKFMENESLLAEHTCGSFDKVCSSCGARHFDADKPCKDGRYTMCCQKGKIVVSRHDFPELLKSLMTNANAHSKNFMENIRAINSSFAFASMGANIAPPPGYGPYCFRIHGQIYHRTGSFLQPNEGTRRRYAQLYILDTVSATNERLAYHGNENCNKDLLQKISELLTDINVFAKSFKMLHEVEEEARKEAASNGTSMPTICMAIKHDRNKDKRRYNVPNENEVAVVFEDIEGEPPFERDILVHCRPTSSDPNARNTKPISILNCNLDPMVYPLFFPRGERSWGTDLELRKGNAAETDEAETVNTRDDNYENRRSRISQMQFYSSKLQVRNIFNPLLNGGKLTQQFVVDAYVRMEANRLNYVKKHQKKLKAESYSGLMDHLNNRAQENGLKVGRTVILPSSFEGSPRNYQQRYQDAMAIVTKFGKPDLFITMTCNPKWKEITDNLEEWQKGKPEHRPDLVARVFLIKLNSLLEDLKNELFGKVVGKIHVIEFQKRGLPHAHILIILANESKLRNEEDIDKIVSAEIPDKNKYPILHEIVVKNMIHTPCGKSNPKAPCMDQGECQKKFPKEFNETTIGDIDGYPKYRRRKNDPIEVRGNLIDNRWVVPYNPFLLKKYNCHINVEVCASIKSVKYLFKYVYKGHDRSSFKVNENGIVYDEPQDYVDSRYVSAPEAIWRLFAFPMHQQSHAIIRLAVHLPNEQTVYFSEADESEVLANKLSKNSTLMAWFELNKKDIGARQFLYREIPDHYVFTKGEWNPRKSSRNLIGRMYSVSIKDQERYFLRLLLLHVKGATSFEDLRTVDGKIFESFKAAARAKGLLLDDSMWQLTLEEAVVFNMPKQLRHLFAYICVFGPPANPRLLWDEFKYHMVEDYCHRFHNNEGVCTECEGYALKDIQDILVVHGKSCNDFELPDPASEIPDFDLEFNQEDERKTAELLIRSLNEGQINAFREIQAALEDNYLRPKCFFLDGPGGSGKTYLYQTLMHYVRGIGKTVLAAATTGIAANLLDKGRTIHSLYGLPIPLNETSVSRITVRSKAADAIRNAHLLIIDECTMASNFAVNTIDRLLKEIMDNNVAFGGKVILFGGDFRQCLPIIPHAMRPAIVQGSMKFSKPWMDGKFRHLALTSNMRSVDPDYSSWLLKLGNGTLRNESFVEDVELVEIPSEFICDNIVSATFGEKISVEKSKESSKMAILCPKNDDVDKLNEEVMNILEGDYTIYLSDDSVNEDSVEEQDNFNVEFLNSITPSGMPNHCLKLKVGAIIMLLRNLNTKRGLCNGTRLVVTSLKTNLIEAEVLTGSAEGEKVFIPRIDLCPSETGLPFKLNRRQFPVKPAFAMTINKSQGQTLNKVGIYLTEPVFGHGQLYVAFSRVKQNCDVNVQIIGSPLQGMLEQGSDRVFTRNVVFQEVL